VTLLCIKKPSNKSKKGLIILSTPTTYSFVKGKYKPRKGQSFKLVRQYNSATSMSIIRVIIIVKAFNNNEWSLYSFIT
jgi:hypothetical protein